MAKVIIDCNMFSEQWFKKNVLSEFIDEKAGNNVLVIYSDNHKSDTETSKVRAAMVFYKLMSSLKKLIVVPKADAENEMDTLNNCDAWSNCNACDDPHIFAMVRHHPRSYVFTTDRRISDCRKRIRGSIDKEFCQFTLIHADQTFDIHKQKILS